MKNIPKFIVVGASGFIGKHLLKKASQVYSTCGTSSSGENGLLELNLFHPKAFDYDIINLGDVVLFTAAISAPDVCVHEYEYAWGVNVTGTSYFISQAISRGAKVIFFSSDTVYGECEESFVESLDGNPVGEYAEMKMAVEKSFFGNPLFKSVRLSYVFSKEDKFTKYLFGCSESAKEAELFHPFYRAIIHRDDVVDGVLGLANRWADIPDEVINFGGPEVLSRVDFAECLQQNIIPNLRFQVIKPGEKFFKNRPRVIQMSSKILPKLLGRPSQTLLEAVHREFNL